LTDVIAGQTQLMFDTMLSAMPHVKGGKLKALAVTSARRSPAAPELPTVAESGLPGYEAIAWNGLLAPAGTPPDVMARLNAELKKALALARGEGQVRGPGLRGRHGTRPRPSAASCDAEVDKWAQGGQGVGRHVWTEARMIDPANLMAWPFADIVHSYTATTRCAMRSRWAWARDPMDRGAAAVRQ
jgi:hypothetical protein